MKILHVLGQTEDVGGVLSVIRNVQEATREAGVTHVVYVNRAYRETREPGLEYRYGDRCLDEDSSHIRLLIRGWRASGELKGLLGAEPFDVVHGHFRGMLPALARYALWDGREVLFTNHTYARRVRLYQVLAKQRRFHTVLLSANMARHYDLSPDLPRIRVIPDCCADRYFSCPLVARRRVGKDGERLRLVGMGSILRWKGWHWLLEALARLPNELRRCVEFHHYGPVLDLAESREYHRTLLNQAGEAGFLEQVVFHGSTGGVESVLREADWFVLPSTNEPCSVALSEAMALGLPALVSASGGNIDLVEDGRTGVWFEPDRPESLAEKLCRILSGQVAPVAPAEIREAARARSASVVGGEYLRLYRALAERRSKAGIGRAVDR